ncbi:MAG: helix-turn-helix domain-containing protein [Bacteroidaceae bacterium]|nr:helix-turn-helix domain-containing protein [Bacteroidaceae bacterium]
MLVSQNFIRVFVCQCFCKSAGRGVWLFLLWLMLCVAVEAQEKRMYHVLPTQAMLPVSNVNVIMQDSEGYMWYGTAGGGLCRDDGYQVVAYGSKGEGRGVVENDEVTCLAEGKDGTIWFGTRVGAYYINKKDGRMHRLEDEHIGAKKVNCMSVTADGCVWIGVARDVLKFSADGRFLKVLSIGENSREEVKEMMVDSKGMLWLTILRGGLATIQPKKDVLTQLSWDYPYAAGFVVEDTVRHCYWVGTWGGGIVRYPDMVAEPATMVTTEKQKFGSEVYNMWIDQKDAVIWVATMDDVYAYKISGAGKEKQPLLQPMELAHLLPKGKKMVNKLFVDRKENIWVPGYSPHTFILSKGYSGGHIHRDEVKAMAAQMGYKIMVHRIVREGDYYWIYQNRTRLSLYHAETGQLVFMATDAKPEPLSTQRVLAKCQSQQGVWTCNGKRLVHAWHEGMTIHWEEIPEAQTPNYISALSDEGNGRLLMGTEKQVFLFNYRQKVLKRLTDSVGIIQQVRYDQNGKLRYTTNPKAPLQITDKNGHLWTLNELTLKESAPKTGASRTLYASDANIGMDFFTDITSYGDSICLGGIGAFCMIGSCRDLDGKRPDDSIMVTRYDTLHSVSVSTMNHLYAASIQYAYRFDEKGEWTELPVGKNVIDISEAEYGHHTLWVKATDEFGVWHTEQPVLQFEMPLPWWLRWWAWCIYAVVALIVFRIGWKGVRNEGQGTRSASQEARDESQEARDETEKQIDPFLQKVEMLVYKNLDNSDYGVDDLSRDLGMSRMNMYRKFRSLSIKTPSDYMKSCRLKKAMELLKSSTASVTEVAYRVGFSSPQYFAKCFKDEYGMTPREVSRGAVSED